MNKGLILTILLCSSVAHAADNAGRVGVGIGDDSEVKLLIFLSDSVSIKYGVYFNEYNRSETVDNNYSRDQFTQVLGIRKYTGLPKNYQWFFDFEYSRRNVQYSGDTLNEDNDQTILGGYTGVEYILDSNVSVDARLGIELYETDFETFKDNGSYFPTTNISLNYLF